ncbi:MAG: hypothetical protein A4E36_01155 [Methanoregulaceae archaeon PtaB.Bin009]|jgi:predicted RNase H-like nuclease (RuvC/YqgF family)|nr:MAG: hypothetical protein A4E36_01155 [Methanoregulaceae archaeon PtaB.Bin009]HNQ30464.1 DUF460 domain-containing protein [Methanolinea sp.]
MKIFGIDVIKGSVRSRSRRPMYALVILHEREIVSESEVSGFRLLRLLNAERPDILAVDSLQEIAVDQHDLFSFLQALPPSVRLVQVTGGERKETLGKVASRFNISFNRFDPFDEARTIARVAALGAGAEVVAFENESEIVVSRHRSPGKGGWSQNRYVRKMHGAVQAKAREIGMELMAAGLRYEKKETRAFGGCSRVSFTVRAPRDQIPVSTFRGADVQVRISGKRLERIRFRPLSSKPPYLIAGIDPGTTTAIAALDLDGTLLLLQSSRQISMSGVIEALYRVGKPLIVASDVHDMPFSVEKIRRAFNAVAHTPRQDMSVEAKQTLTSGYSCQNDHERDALSAALEAYRTYRNKFQSLQKRVPPGYELEEVRAGIVRGQSVEQVIGDLNEKAAPTEEKAPAVEMDAARDERIRILDGTIKRLRILVGELQEDLRERDLQVMRLQERLKRVRSRQDQKVRADAEVTKRDVIIQNLKKRLRKEERTTRAMKRRVERMKEFDEALLSGETIPLKILPALTREAIKTFSAEMGIREGDVLYVSRIEGFGKSVAKDLSQEGIAALLVGEFAGKAVAMEVEAVFRELDIPLIAADQVRVVVKGGRGAADPGQFRDAVKRWKELQDRYEKEKKGRMLEDIFREYRAERGKEMKKVG